LMRYASIAIEALDAIQIMIWNISFNSVRTLICWSECYSILKVLSSALILTRKAVIHRAKNGYCFLFFAWIYFYLLIIGETALFEPQPSLEDAARTNPVFSSLDFATVFFFQSKVVSVVSITQPGGPGLCIYVPQWRSRVRFPALPDFLTSRGSGTGSTQPRDHNRGAAWKKK
jgi:hypothetical protein